MNTEFYRRGVGIMLVNRDGLVWVGQRLDNAADAWQMPQGGLDEGEEALDGAYRELEEETGISPGLTEIIACSERELTYDIPDAIAEKLWRGRWRGQRQIWYLARFLGNDADVDIVTEHPEFRAWKWAEPASLPALIVPFKRALYQDLLEIFAGPLAAAPRKG